MQLGVVLFTSFLKVKRVTNAQISIHVIVIAMALQNVTSLGIHDNSNRPRREDDSVNCQAGVVAAGRTATITCNFNIDVNETKHDFIVETKPPDVPDTNRPKTVLWCHWLGPVKLECDLLEGVKFNYVVSDHIRVEISKATEQFAGLYTCRTVPPDNRPVHDCNLIVESTVTPICDSKSSTAELTTSTGTCTDRECSSYGTVEALAVVTALMTCIVVALIVVIVILRKTRRNYVPEPHVTSRCNGIETEVPILMQDNGSAIQIKLEA